MQLDEISAFVFLDIAVVVVVARLVGGLFQRIRQPAVVGEIIGGILLGPTLVGRLPGNLTATLFPVEVRPFLSVIAQLGLIIFMFIVGMELDLKLVRSHGRSAAVISLSSIILPFSLGCLLAVGIYHTHKVVAGETVDFTAFALFIGASMSITAFPVLARILTERGMLRTPIGTLALASAAVDDVVAWSILAVVVAVVEATGVWDLPRILLMSFAFVAFMFLVVRPQLARLNDRYREAGQLTPGILSVVLVGLLLSSFVTSRIGIHSIFGAFLFGTAMPRKKAQDLLHDVLGHIEPVSVLLLLPIFFVATGLTVDVGGIGLAGLDQLALILLVACAGKLVGAAVAARAQGIPTRKAAAIGILMNTRGLTELVILNVGLSKGVLDPELFTMLVVMAVLTTVITEPLLRITYTARMQARDIAGAERARRSVAHPYKVVVGIGDAPGDPGPIDPGPIDPGPIDPGPIDLALIDTAVSLAVDERFREIVLIALVPSPPSLRPPGEGAPTVVTTTRTEALVRMASLGDAVRARGIPCQVQSCLGDAPAEELVEQATTAEAHVILLAGSDSGMVDEVRSRASCQVVVMDPSNVASDGDSVVALVGGGPDAYAAVEIAVRVASARRVALEVVSSDPRTGGRKLRHAVEVLARDGIECEVTEVGPDKTHGVDRPLDGRTIVVGGGGEVGGTVAAATTAKRFAVHAGETDEADFSRLIERRARAQRNAERPAQRGAEPPAPSVTP